jgi:hypothetical protein
MTNSRRTKAKDAARGARKAETHAVEATRRSSVDGILAVVIADGTAIYSDRKLIFH